MSPEMSVILAAEEAAGSGAGTDWLIAGVVFVVVLVAVFASIGKVNRNAHH